ncbi:neurotrimin-like [Anopheles cruzii]|uniref:neurotrimin-like n=1 Tax=Anopheles cruzii TaxID=68878 RepID=UPI0022EC7403|nr:neurotrimin-like [Anopheles cruzii]
MGYINLLELKLLLNISLVVLLVNGHGTQTEAQPEFLAALDNLTVTQGRDVSFTCVVNNLGQYRVAWIKSDSKAILAIHTHMVALNPRLSVTHNGHNTWKLHISHVQLNDSGSYMCQVNTDPMRHQSGNLDVVVPPDILNEHEPNTLEGGVANEAGNVQLVCQATGVPEPTVQWRRENGKDIVVRTEGREKQVVKFIEGERLVLNQVQRTDMGGYLCIASNGVPPSVSKRFDVQVNFPPNVKAGNQLVAAPVESHVLLQCVVEAFPTPLNGWHKHDGGNAGHGVNGAASGNGGMAGGTGTGGTGGNGLEKPRNTQMPAPIPSRQPLWILNNKSPAASIFAHGRPSSTVAFVSCCLLMIYSLLMLPTFT